MKTTIKLKRPQNRPVNGRVYEIDSIDTYTHKWVNEDNTLGKSRKKDGYISAINVIANAALSPNGMFADRGDRNSIIVRLSDVNGTNLVRNDWIIPGNEFNRIVLNLQVKEPYKFKEYMFHIHPQMDLQ